jgi:hypothetical protein
MASVWKTEHGVLPLALQLTAQRHFNTSQQDERINSFLSAPDDRPFQFEEIDQEATVAYYPFGER